jgi:hypothetical protein
MKRKNVQNNSEKVSKLLMVDLAGSEKSAQTTELLDEWHFKEKHEQEKLRLETKNINISL